ncbi:MAG: Asp-tRNA(Asn)/Glu-tRNA(Gln) amidotransferase subunit GatC [Aeromicrobium sp.]|uniref:Asp-tRNA(Asn)/Glu-tRNA(Gln) amidotransferase subunit GatC n=1 Tax=Aeromicrobium sp. TaxID=1871063 RepID=UPI0039E3B64F
MPSPLSREDVAHLASLARISLNDAELDRLGAELPAILDHVAAVQGVVDAAGEDTRPMSHPIPVTNVFRVDEVREGLTPEAALAGAPESEEQRFLVPKILGEE